MLWMRYEKPVAEVIQIATLLNKKILYAPTRLPRFSMFYRI